MYLFIPREQLSLKRVCPPSRDNHEEEKVSDLKVAKVSGNMCYEFQGVKETFGENFEGEDHQKEDYQDEFTKKLCQKLAEYNLGEEIGQGGFGCVFSGTRKVDNLPVAIKLVEKSSVTEFFEIDGQKMPSEAYFLNKVQHRHVVKFYQGFTLEDYYVYVMERPQNCQDLEDVLDERHLTEDESRRYFKQILDATIFCEENGVVHRDLKPANILLDERTDEIKLIDFGLASKLQYEPYNTFRGTKAYMPPEFVRFGWYDGSQSTVWALGMILVNLLSSSMAFRKPEEALSRSPRLKANVSQEARDLVSTMLNINPLTRPSLKQILRHPWMTMKEPTDDVLVAPFCAISFYLENSDYDKSCISVAKDGCLNVLSPAAAHECHVASLSQNEASRFYATSLSEQAMINSSSNEERQDGQIEIPSELIDYDASTMIKESCDLKSKYNERLRPLCKDTADSLDSGFHLNAVERRHGWAFKHNKKLLYIPRNTEDGFRGCGPLRSRMERQKTEIFERDSRRRMAQNHSDRERNELFAHRLKRNSHGDLNPRRKFRMCIKTVEHTVTSERAFPVRHEWRKRIGFDQSEEYGLRRNSETYELSEKGLRQIDEGHRKKEGQNKVNEIANPLRYGWARGQINDECVDRKKETHLRRRIKNVIQGGRFLHTRLRRCFMKKLKIIIKLLFEEIEIKNFTPEEKL
ncbi:CBL-interacting protein kinase 15-like [Acropora millepora]|uniref:CBL-interacting protein kinase 15-like n=1 Tax=Acropora millepora TaxID=45264 RepID=UPI001CF160B0|nr:CBL-interacting protein kinase 15-like [Acropora millepora]